MKFSLIQALAALVFTLGLGGCVLPSEVEQLSPGQVIKDCDVCPELVVIPAGSFQMGSDEGDDEEPIHPVNIKSFLLGKTEVTLGQWRALMGSNPSRFTKCADNCPVERVRWRDAQTFIRKLNTISGRHYRLASEAEWEYAARAGSQAKWSFGDDESVLPNHAWFFHNSESAQAVGQKDSNAFGLHDMHGNVWELVADCWHDNYAGAPDDGSASNTGCTSGWVSRGGSWASFPSYLSSSSRRKITQHYRSPDIGFRLARNLVTP